MNNYRLIEKMSIEGTLVEPIRNHFSHLGIRSSLGIDGIAATLRQLLVNQWLGPDMDYYVNFFGNAGFNFRQEAIRFLDPNVFASPLGDAMPLGIANILRLPIMILSQQNLSPFIEISPREIISSTLSIFLAYNHRGPGHYDALVDVEGNENNSPNVEAQHHHNPTPQLSETKTPPRKSCRCGRYSGATKRTYKSRCTCVREHSTCDGACKCKGTCGGIKCREFVETTKKTRKHWSNRKSQTCSQPQ